MIEVATPPLIKLPAEPKPEQLTAIVDTRERESMWLVCFTLRLVGDGERLERS